MHKHVHIYYQNSKIPDEGFSASDILSVIAILISLAGVVFTYYSIFTAKQVDVKYLKFEKLCLQNIEKIFQSIDDIFLIQTTTVGSVLFIITDTITELNLFLSQIKDVYSNLNLQEISDMLDDFSDKAYQTDPSFLVSTLKGDYYAAKTKLYHYLYDFAIKKDLNKT